MGPFPNQGNNIPQKYQLMQTRKIIRFQLSSLTSMQTKLSIDTTTKINSKNRIIVHLGIMLHTCCIMKNNILIGKTRRNLMNKEFQKRNNQT
jgi:hypothetical protein